MYTTPVSLLEGLRQTEVNPDKWSHSWEKVVRLNTPLLFARARHRYALDEGAAENLVCDLFARLWQPLQSFDRQRNGSFRRYLFTTLHRLYLEARSGRDETGAWTADLPDDSNAIDDLVESEYRAYVLRRALELMRQDFPKVWEPAWAHLVGGTSIADAARQFGTTPGALYVAVHRIKERLRVELNGLLD